ncbi:hypothetical protein [Methanobrevibacter sp.]|uniref:hypothetical protein n=1 Tax=Methanobrevibacter sp. TaxID=66852 RepID=UPI003D7D6751
MQKNSQYIPENMNQLELDMNHPKILTISSDELLLNEIKEYLEEYDYEFLSSDFNKENIKQKITEDSPSLILLDTDQEKYKFN